MAGPDWQRAKEVFAAAPDLRIDVTDVAADGEVVLVAWELAATFTGAPFHGLTKAILGHHLRRFHW